MASLAKMAHWTVAEALERNKWLFVTRALQGAREWRTFGTGAVFIRGSHRRCFFSDSDGIHILKYAILRVHKDREYRMVPLTNTCPNAYKKNCGRQNTKKGNNRQVDIIASISLSLPTRENARRREHDEAYTRQPQHLTRLMLTSHSLGSLTPLHTEKKICTAVSPLSSHIFTNNDNTPQRSRKCPHSWHRHHHLVDCDTDANVVDFL